MNEKHYDNLCEAAGKLSINAIEFAVMVQASALSNILSTNRDETIEIVAATYNLLDILCIALNCEDEVQDMAEQIVVDNLASKA